MSKQNKDDKFSRKAFYIIISLLAIIGIGSGVFIAYVIVNSQNGQLGSQAFEEASKIESVNNDENKLKDEEKNMEDFNLTDEEINRAEEYYSDTLEYLVEDPKHATYIINKAIDIDSNNIKYLKLKMLALSFTGKNDEVISLGEGILNSEIKLTNFDKQDIYGDLMIAYEEVGEYEKSLLYTDKAIAISEDEKRTATYYVNKGNIHHKLNQYKRALESYKKSSEIVGTEDEIYKSMSYFYEKLGDPNDMIQFSSLLYIYNTSMEKLYNSYVDEIDYELEILNKALAKGEKYVDYNFPAIHKAFLLMGTVNTFTTFKDMSEEMDQLGTKADSFYEDYYEEIKEDSEVEYSSDEKEILEMIKFLKEAVTIYPERAAGTYFTIGMQYFDLKEYDEGIKYIILSVEHDITTAYSSLSSAASRLYGENQNDRAKMLLEIGVEMDPHNKTAYLMNMQ